jgi:hypothetical protein
LSNERNGVAQDFGTVGQPRISTCERSEPIGPGGLALPNMQGKPNSGHGCTVAASTHDCSRMTGYSELADQQAWESARRPKPCLLATHSKLQEIVASKLMQDWSPQQISGWLKRQYPHDESLRVSHETIYRSRFIQARSAETGAGAASAIAAADPPLAALQHSRALPRTDRRCHLHPRKTCGSRRSCHSRPLARSCARPP